MSTEPVGSQLNSVQLKQDISLVIEQIQTGLGGT